MRIGRTPGAYRTRLACAVLCGGFLFGAGGCFKRSFDARPGATFEDLGSDRQDYEQEDFRIRTTDFGAWRFPTSLAVARVTVANTECLPDQHRLVFSPVVGTGCPPWHESMQNMPWISEVFLLQPHDFAHERISIKQIVRRAKGYRARLCLVYAETDLIDKGARVIGVLFDTRSTETVATLVARHVPAEHGFEIDRPRDRHRDDDRHVDSRYQAGRKFRGLVQDCILELVERHGAGAEAETSVHALP